MFKNILTAFLFITSFIIFSFSIYADETEHEYWGDDYFDNPIDSTKKEEVKEPTFQISSGFFPKPYLKMNFFWIGETIGWNYSTGKIAISEQFSFHKLIYSAQPPMKTSDFEDKTEEKEKFSDKDKYGFFKNPPYKNQNIGFSIEYPILSLHTILSAKVGYSNRYIHLYSPVGTKYFLGYNGEKMSFEEISVLEIDDKKIYTAFDLRHPIYGAFLRTDNTEMNIFYYLTYGIGCDFTINDKLSSFEYILSENKNIRYSNGEIKEASLFKEKYDGIKNYRYNYSIGIGWQFGVNDVNSPYSNNNVSIELKYRGSLNSIFKEHNFKQNTLFFTTNVDVKFMIDVIKFWIPGI